MKDVTLKQRAISTFSLTPEYPTVAIFAIFSHKFSTNVASLKC